MRKMKNPMKPLVSILNLYPKIFKVVQATAFRPVTNKSIQMPSNTKARLSAHEYNVLGSIWEFELIFLTSRYIGTKNSVKCCQSGALLVAFVNKSATLGHLL